MMFVSLCTYGVVSLSIFTFGDELAKERGRGWPRTLRATPLPTWVYLAGKMATAAIYALLIVVAMGPLAALAGGVSLRVTQWLVIAAIMVGGVLAFATFGFALAYLVRPRAATAIANLVFLPLAFFSGFFFPLGELPRSCARSHPGCRPTTSVSSPGSGSRRPPTSRRSQASPRPRRPCTWPGCSDAPSSSAPRRC